MEKEKFVNLVHLCEPAFEFVCRLNKIARNGGQLEYPHLRSEVEGILARIRRDAAATPRLQPAHRRVEAPLAIFLDFSIVNSGINCAAEWDLNRLAFEHNIMSGDEEFFDLFEEAEADPSGDATEALAVFYTCVGLGFTGFLADQTEFLKQKMDRVLPRIRQYIESDPNARIAPDTYQHTDRSDLVEPPGSKLLGLAIAFAGVFFVVFAAVIVLFQQAAGDLNNSVNAILRKDPAAATTQP